jgi:hypothetical protein
MATITESITENITQLLNIQISRIMDYSGIAVVFAVLFIFAYVIGTIAAETLRKILKYQKLEEFIVKYGILRTKAWGDATGFLVFYTKWYSIAFILTLSDITLITAQIYPFMHNLLGFIILIFLGLTIGGIASKFVRDISMDFGWEDKLVKYGLADALGDISITSMLTGIVKFYIVVLFVAEGIGRFENLVVLSKLMNDIIAYTPQAILGSIIMLVALLIADYAGDRVKHHKLNLEASVSLGIKAVIIFFGAVIALPHFGVENVSILEDSFKILMVGIALAIAIAGGLGLKDYVSKMAQKNEEKKPV